MTLRGPPPAHRRRCPRAPPRGSSRPSTRRARPTSNRSAPLAGPGGAGGDPERRPPDAHVKSSVSGWPSASTASRLAMPWRTGGAGWSRRSCRYLRVVCGGAPAAVTYQVLDRHVDRETGGGRRSRARAPLPLRVRPGDGGRHDDVVADDRAGPAVQGDGRRASRWWSARTGVQVRRPRVAVRRRDRTRTGASARHLRQPLALPTRSRDYVAPDAAAAVPMGGKRRRGVRRAARRVHGGGVVVARRGRRQRDVPQRRPGPSAPARPTRSTVTALRRADAQR